MATPWRTSSVARLRTEPLGTVRVAFVGLGDRGRTALRLMLDVPKARVVALCDVEPANVEAAIQVWQTAADSEPQSPLPQTFVGTDAYLSVCRSSDIDLVYICSDWASHARICVAAMLSGKHAAVEVPAATTMEEIHTIVATAEQARRHCFLLENCCYDPALQAAIRDIRRGVVGIPVHAEGSYYHCLGDRWTTWRLDMNSRQRGDLYPTHELAPLCMALGVSSVPRADEEDDSRQHGATDRMTTLVCMDSAAFTGPGLYEAHTGQAPTSFQNGDHTTTLIRTAQGKTILLRHDVLTPQPYERMFRVVGTKDAITVNDDGTHTHDELTRRMNNRLIHCLSEGLPLDWDVYDLATWCSVIPLSQQSAEQGFLPVEVPDWRR